jgi:hypothetical protein
VSRASEAYKALTLAMDDIAPACKNDGRFIADDQKTDVVAPICRACPLYDLCAVYGDLERPKAGIWAGRRYRTNSPRKTSEGGIA